MASTYSTNLGIELIANGEKSGTWGTTTNTNLGTLIEEAIVGIGSVAVTDGSTATSVTTSNGVSSTGRCRILIFTGALTANRTVELPVNRKKVYTLINSTTGGYSLTVKVAGGSNTITLRANARREVYCKGTEIFDLITDLPSGMTIEGTTIVTSTYAGSLTLSSGVLTVPGGSLSSPSITFSSPETGANTGLYSVADGYLTFVSNGAAIATVMPTGFGINGTLAVTGGATLTDSITFSTSGKGIILSGGGTLIDDGSSRTLLYANGDKFEVAAESSGTSLFVVDNSLLAPFFKGQAIFHTGNFSHNHDDRYYTESEIASILSGYATTSSLSSYLPLAGGTITGDLVLSGSGHGVTVSNGQSSFTVNGNTTLEVNRTVSTGAIMGCRFNSTVVGSITVTGSATSFNTSSDRRLKKDIEDLTGYVEFVKGLRPRWFTWKSTEERVAGFIADEAQVVARNSVVGEPDGEEMQAMQAGSAEIIANLTATVQHLLQRVEELEARG